MLAYSTITDGVAFEQLHTWTILPDPAFTNVSKHDWQPCLAPESCYLPNAAILDSVREQDSSRRL